MPNFVKKNPKHLKIILISIMLFFILFSLFFVFVYADSPQKCNINKKGCYKKDGNSAKAGTLSPSQFSYHLAKDKCEREKIEGEYLIILIKKATRPIKH